MILGIHHVQITIPKGAEAEGREFYCGVLELPEIEKPASLQGRGGFWLQVGKKQVHVGTEDGVDRWASKAHIAYQVDNLEYWRARLTAHDIHIEEQIPIPHHHRFEFRDPFGNRIELTEVVA
jgi:catechol 2,3-dioxygenase-like lactoylglutathione lyase family enzyme